MELAKTVPEQDVRGGIWLIGWLCERAFRSRLTLREEGQVELLGETPKQLSATASLPKIPTLCQQKIMYGFVLH